MPPVTKFTYLRELLDDRVRKTIDALPHTAEGYNRAVAKKEKRDCEGLRKFVLGIKKKTALLPVKLETFPSRLHHRT